MNHQDLKKARQDAGLTQVTAAERLGVSQPYLAMVESGARRLTEGLARRAEQVYGLPATALPPVGARTSDSDALAMDLSALGYPRLAHLGGRRLTPKNPVDVLLAALGRDDLDARLVEALPWVLLEYPTLDADWLVREAKLHDLQNRLGFVVSLARRLGERRGDGPRLRALRLLEATLDRSRLAREDTLCRASLPEAERRWLDQHRSEDAHHWNLLTDWTVNELRYGA